MQRPEVRIVSKQEEITIEETNISQYEIDNMMAKYGYTQPHHTPVTHNPDSELTFEELINREEAIARKYDTQSQYPPVFTFDPNKMRYQSSSYGSDDECGVGFKITITSDMDINGNMYK